MSERLQYLARLLQEVQIGSMRDALAVASEADEPSVAVGGSSAGSSPKSSMAGGRISSLDAEVAIAEARRLRLELEEERRASDLLSAKAASLRLQLSELSWKGRVVYRNTSGNPLSVETNPPQRPSVISQLSRDLMVRLPANLFYQHACQ